MDDLLRTFIRIFFVSFIQFLFYWLEWWWVVSFSALLCQKPVTL